MTRLFVFVLSIGFCCIVHAVPQMTVTPTTVAVGQAVRVIFSNDKPLTLPDLTVLSSDFTVRGMAQKQQVSSVNGVTQNTYQIVVTMYPKKEGTLSIGPFTIEQTLIQPIDVQVVPRQRVSTVSSVKTSGLPDEKLTSLDDNSTGIFQVTAQLDPTEIYIGESALLTFQFWENIGVLKAQIETSQNPDYTIEPFGQDKLSVRQTTDNQSVRVYQRSFLVTPRRDGVMTVSGGVIGLIANRQPQRRLSPFSDFFGQDDFFNIAFDTPTEEVVAQAKPVSLVVKGKPTDWQGWWFPSRQVTLSEQYQIPDRVVVGQPIERHVQLKALRVDASQLPLIVQGDSSSIKAYANPEKRTVVPTRDGPVAYEERTFVLVPIESGDVVIPSIRVDWFNTKTGQKETAVLPAKTIRVYPSQTQMLSDTSTPTDSINSQGTPAGKSEKTGAEIRSDAGNQKSNTSDILKKQEAWVRSDGVEQSTATSGILEKPKALHQQIVAFIKQTYGLFGLFELILMGLVFVLVLILVGVARYEVTHQTVRDVKTGVKKKKKPLADLYPFQ